MGHITILGQHISLIRPLRVKVHSTKGAWKRPILRKVRNILLSHKDKTIIAAQMGYRLTEG